MMFTSIGRYQSPWIALAWLLLAILAPPGNCYGADQAFSRWEKAISAFEVRDAKSPPPLNGVLFIGSSSIRNWDLSQSFPGKHYINRGFGGSQIADSTYFADRIILPYKPQAIVLYAGDNDIAAGKTPRQVAEDFRSFVAVVQAKLPQTQVIFISIKPSLSRWTLVEKMRQANQQIAQFIDSDRRLTFVDVDKPMLGQDGKPRKALFAADGLHLSEAGYRLWKSLVEPHLEISAQRKSAPSESRP